jgi:tRNA nucleotidyltransferase (CCA-adding enzyme)
MKIINELQQLNDIFKEHNAKLFVVGGYVRDSLLSLNPTDIDIASRLENSELEEILKNSGFSFKLASKKLGTTIIIKNNIKFEHTTFRQESYKKGGHHSPDRVEFVKEIEIDAKRRDFTVNSMYYDIEEEKVIDFFAGAGDLKLKQVKAIINPEYVFKSDGLRILRMIRIASELDFKIAKNTLKIAKVMVGQLQDITKDRTYREFLLIINANDKYGFEKVNGVKELIELGALEFIFPNIRAISTEHRYKKLLKGLNKKLFYFSTSKNLRLEAFMLDLALHMNRYETLDKPSVTLSKILNPKTSGISVREKNSLINVVKAYEGANKLKDDLTAKKFIQDHFTELDSLLILLNNKRDTRIYNTITENYEFMKKHKMPFSIRQLKIDGNIIKKELKGVEDKQISEVLQKALKFCLLNPNNNTKTKIVKFLKEEEL